MSTIFVENSYTVAAGTELDFHNERAFFLDGSGAPSLTIAGAVRLSIDDNNNYIALTANADGISSLTIAEGGSYVVDQTSTQFASTQAAGFQTETNVVNRGLIEIQAVGSAGGLGFGSGGVVDNFGRISVTSATKSASGITGDAIIHNSGVIEVDGLSASAAYGTVDNSGLIYASGDQGATAVGSAGDFLNTGRVVVTAHEGYAVGVEVQDTGASFSNQGRILATSDQPGDFSIGIRLAPPSADGQIVIDNSGLISADRAVEFASFPRDNPQATLNNSGRIVGAVSLGNAHDEVHNAGKIIGDVMLSDGDDLYQATGKGKVSGVISGDGGADLLIGGKFADTLDGEGDTNQTAGANTLIGGGGADILTGGSGADTFVYRALSDSTAGKSDLILDLFDTDVIDLSKIDADATHAGNQAFHLVAKLDGHAGEASLRYSAASDTTRLSLDVDGDGKADAVITLQGDHHDFAGFVL